MLLSCAPILLNLLILTDANPSEDIFVEYPEIIDKNAKSLGQCFTSHWQKWCVLTPLLTCNSFCDNILLCTVFMHICEHYFSVMDDLGYVLRVLYDAGMVPVWLAIGQTLTVPDSELNIINFKFKGYPKLCLLHMIVAWLRGNSKLEEPPSWWRLVWAIADRHGGDNPLKAKYIAAKFKGAWKVTQLTDIIFTFTLWVFIYVGRKHFTQQWKIK